MLYSVQRDQDTDLVDRSVQVLISCGECYTTDSEITFSLLSSLMKLAGKEMTTMQPAIKQFMLKLEASPDYFIHKIAEGTFFPNKSTSPTPSTARHSRVPTK